ncbi:hypothetical protein DFJ74DRAFT_664976 [Hyaloraphidium curvatum]|nr:hypothetical protein DFJ74DRAFT_664976 [Hyaloraphidium curvatum]
MSASADPSAPLSLLIRSPSLPADHAVSLPRASRVADLKAALAAQLPSRPRAEDQRVIYAGRVLADAEGLEDAVRGNAGTPVLHLVVRGSGLPAAAPKAAEAGQLPAPARNPAPSAAPGLLQRQAPAQAPPAFLYHPVSINGIPYYLPVPVSSPAPPPPAQPAPQPQPAQPAPPPPADDGLDPPAEGDSPLSLLLRLAFLVYLLSQNASFARIVFLHVAAAAVFVWRTGRLRLPGIRRAGQGRGLVAPQAQGDGTGQPAEGQAEVRPRERGWLEGAGNVAYTFVASLVPAAAAE